MYTAPGGQALLQLVDHHGGSLLVLGLALAEVVGVAWVYGVNSIIADLNIMLARSEGEREIVYVITRTCSGGWVGTGAAAGAWSPPWV